MNKTVASWWCIVAFAALVVGCDGTKKQTSTTLTPAQQKEVTEKGTQSMDKNMEVMKGAPAGMIPQKPGGGGQDMSKFFPGGGPPGAPGGAVPGGAAPAKGTEPAKEATPSAPPK